jgi:hypothetical protein
MPFWPEPYRGAISLTFDDGLPSQLNLAVPMLDEAGLRGTFYLNPTGSQESAGVGDSWMERLEPWKPVQAQGHEIGNHSILHPCSLNNYLEWQYGKNLLNWTLDQLAQDVLEAQRRIHEAFPAQKANTFGYPCYEDSVGRGKNRASYTPFIAGHFVAARQKGELRGELANDPIYCDLHHLSSWPVEFQQCEFMIGLAEIAVHLGRWGVFTFHGIDEGKLLIGANELQTLVDFLSRRKDIWVAPLAEIGAYVREHA